MLPVLVGLAIGLAASFGLTRLRYLPVASPNSAATHGRNRYN